jgi:hypothetical protein
MPIINIPITTVRKSAFLDSFLNRNEKTNRKMTKKKYPNSLIGILQDSGKKGRSGVEKF